MDVSENNGTPKSSILIGFSIINHPFWGTPILGNTHMIFARLSPMLSGVAGQENLESFVGDRLESLRKECHEAHRHNVTSRGDH